MTFVADEGVDRSVVERLRTEGHEVLYVAEMDPGIADDEVLRLANERDALLITADKDFGELVFRLGRASPGVLLIRLPGLAAAERANVLSAVVRAHGVELAAAFSVVSAGRVRIRRQTFGPIP